MRYIRQPRLLLSLDCAGQAHRRTAQSPTSINRPPSTCCSPNQTTTTRYSIIIILHLYTGIPLNMDYQRFQHQSPTIAVQHLVQQMPLAPAHPHQASNHKSAMCPPSSRTTAEKLLSGGLRPSIKQHDIKQQNHVHWEFSIIENEPTTKPGLESCILGSEPRLRKKPFSSKLRWESNNPGLARGSFVSASPCEFIENARYSSTLDQPMGSLANTSRSLDERPSRGPTSKEARYGQANTAVKRKDQPQTQRPRSDHRLSRSGFTGMRKSQLEEPSSDSHQSSVSGYPALANSSSRRNSGKRSQRRTQISSLAPPVPDAPQIQRPPPTPRPARLPTPDLDDISERGFCYCCNVTCRSREYPHDSQGRRLSSKMGEQSKLCCLSS